MSTEYQIIGDKLSCIQQFHFSKFNNVTSWGDFGYVVGNSCGIRKSYDNESHEDIMKIFNGTIVE